MIDRKILHSYAHPHTHCYVHTHLHDTLYTERSYLQACGRVLTWRMFHFSIRTLLLHMNALCECVAFSKVGCVRKYGKHICLHVHTQDTMMITHFTRLFFRFPLAMFSRSATVICFSREFEGGEIIVFPFRPELSVFTQLSLLAHAHLCRLDLKSWEVAIEAVCGAFQ